MTLKDAVAPDEEAFHSWIAATITALPAPFREKAAQVVVHVEDLADAETLESFEIEDPFDLTGLYDGLPLTEKSVADQPLQPDAIWLYRLAILAEWAERGDVTLGALVAHVYIHELAHHFGWSDEDIARIDPWWT